MNRQRLLDIAADAIREDLLKPLGLNAPPVPITDGAGVFEIDLRMADGMTRNLASDGTPKIIAVAGWIKEDVNAVAVLAHEMIHSALPYETGHDEVFAKYHKAIGLAEPPTQSKPGPQFIDWFNRRIKPALA